MSQATPNENDAFAHLEATLKANEKNNNYSGHKESLDKPSFLRKGLLIIFAIGILGIGGFYSVMKLKETYFKQDSAPKEVNMDNKQGRGDLGLPTPVFNTAEKKPADTKDDKAVTPTAPILPTSQPMRLSAQIREAPQNGAPGANNGSASASTPAGGANPYNTTLNTALDPLNALKGQKAELDDMLAKINNLGGGGLPNPSALNALSASIAGASPAQNSQPSNQNQAIKLNKAYSLGDTSFIVQGSNFIPCVLQNEIVSSVSGDSVCQVTREIYSANGKNILIPKFSKLVGPYKSELARGETRIANIFNKLIMPDGIEVRLDGYGVGNSGATGLDAEIDNKWFERIGAALMISIFQDGINFGSQQLAYNQYLRESWRKEDAATAAANKASADSRINVTSTTRTTRTTNPDTGVVTESTITNAPLSNSGTTTSNSFATSSSNAVNPPVFGTDSSRTTMRGIGEKILEQQLQIKPVARIRKGTEIQVYIKESLDFSGVYTNAYASIGVVKK